MPVSKEVLPGFKSVDEGIKIIKAHNRQHPTVDLPRMMRGYDYILKGNNFNLFLQEFVKGKLVDKGVVPMTLYDNLDVERLKAALRDKFAELAGQEFDEARVRIAARSSMVTDDDTTGKLRKAKAMTEVGKDISAGRTYNPGDYKSTEGSAILSTVVGE